MVAKKVRFSDDARRRMLRGIDVLSDAVRVTLGPKGRNVVLGKDYGAPRITKDGVTVARDVELGDKFENMGAQMAREVALRASYKAGDGTTTATVLAQAIASGGAKLVAAGFNPVGLKRGIDIAVAAVVADLKGRSKSISSDTEIEQVGTISANGDRQIGKFLAEAIREVGENGMITVEQADRLDTEVHVVKGMTFDRGYISSSFVTDFDQMRVELDDPLILIVEKKLSALHELLPLLDKVKASGRPLFIIAEGVEGEVLRTLAINKARGSLRVAASKAPGYGPSGKALLQDIAILTGGHAICEELGIRLEDASIKLLGGATKVTIDRESTTIVGGAGIPDEIAARIRELRGQLRDDTSDFDREKLEERIARLACGVAVIRVGGTSELEALERKDRVANALHATRAAIAEGILPGGGIALLRSARALDEVDGADEDERNGIELVKRSLAAPAGQIVINSGAEAAPVIGKILAHETYVFGYDAQTAEYGDLVSKGILDPTKVVRTSLQAAASISGLLITTEAMIADLYERVEPEGGHHHHHGNMDIDF